MRFWCAAVCRISVIVAHEIFFFFKRWLKLAWTRGCVRFGHNLTRFPFFVQTKEEDVDVAFRRGNGFRTFHFFALWLYFMVKIVSPLTFLPLCLYTNCSAHFLLKSWRCNLWTGRQSQCCEKVVAATTHTVNRLLLFFFTPLDTQCYCFLNSRHGRPSSRTIIQIHQNHKFIAGRHRHRKSSL